MSTTISSSAVDGLVSGLDTSSIISSLLSVDAGQQNRLKNNVSAAQAKVSAYQSVNTKLAALQTAAAALQKATAWSPTTATSSDATVTATTSGTAVPTSMNVTVNSLAAGRSVVSGVYATDAAQVNGFPLDVVRNDGSFVTIQPSTGSFKDVSTAVGKAAALGISAVALRVGDNSYRLQITSTRSGASDGDFVLRPHTSGDGSSTDTTASTGTDGKKLTDGSASAFTALKTQEATDRSDSSKFVFTEEGAAANASISYTVGGSSTAYPLTSATNTFANVLTGVSLTVTKTSPSTTTGGVTTATPATVTIASDPNSLATAVQNMVTAANSALTEIGARLKSGVVAADGSVTGAGALRGDSTLRSLQSQILQSVTTALGGAGASGTSAATYGLQSTRDGSLVFDQKVFLAAYAKDPAKTQSLLAPTSVDPASSSTGVAERLVTLATGATSRTGSLTLAIAGQNTSISQMQSSIADWDVRLADRKERYQKYYSNLETALGKLKSQSTWLSGQLAGLSG